MTLSLSEIFTSIQGEGPFMGLPALFIRLSGCIAPFCPWCDTPYAQGAGKTTAVKEILSKATPPGIRLAVITGGEPFLQWEAGLGSLETALIAMGLSVQYETSGKVPIPDDARGYKVCSPKFLDGHWQMAPGNTTKADSFKFVVCKDMDRIDAFVSAHAIAPEKVWLMPLGDNQEDQLRRSPAVWQACVDNGYNFSPRLHTLIFNNKKGI